MSSKSPLIKWVVAAGMVLALAGGIWGCPGGPPSGVDERKDIVYGQGYVASEEGEEYVLKNLLLDAYVPDEGSQRPAVLLVHGGNFTEGSKEKEEIVEFARYFAARGYVAFAMNYRLTGDSPPAPMTWNVFNLTSAVHAAIIDVKAALRFIHANAFAYGVDPTRVAVLGESAGAVAGIAAAMGSPSRFTSDGDSFPVPETNYPEASMDVAAYIHLWGGADHVLTDLGSEDPPIMIVHGEDDDRFFVSFGASQRLHAVLELLNLPHEFYEAEDFGHGAWDYRYQGRSLKALCHEFLEEYLG